jgi:polysaccharide biosynthesis transport protein
MELKELVGLFRRWWWLLLVGLVLGLAGGLTASLLQTPVYEASAKVLITRTRQPGTTDVLSISDQQLVLTYLQLLKTQSILEEVGSRLGGKINVENVKVDVIPDTQIIQIKIQDPDPRQAATIANTLVQILIEQNETLQAGRYMTYEQSLNSQVTQVQAQISALQSQITDINQANIEQQLDLVNQQIGEVQGQLAALQIDISQFPALLSAIDRARLAEKEAQVDQIQSLLALYQEIRTNLQFVGKPVPGSGSIDLRVTSLQATLALYQQLYLNLLNNLEAVKLAHAQSTPTVTRIEEAPIPKKPIRPIPVLYTALAGIVGVALAAGAMLLLDYFDDTLKSRQKIQQALGIPIIGEIVRVTRGKSNHNGTSRHKQTRFVLSKALGSMKIDVSIYPRDQAGFVLSNAFGSLRINVSRLLEHKSLKSVLITSASAGEGKTTIALNLAAAFVRSGKRVALVDADFHHPQLHARLGLDNQRGLSNILADGIGWREVTREFGGIDVITSGVYSPAAIELLESSRMAQLLKQLQKEQDIVIIDGPPLFIEDSQILASRVAGVLLVIRQGNTLTAAARAMIDQLKLIDANVLGVVLNGVPSAENYYFDGSQREITEKKLEKAIDKVNLAET